MSYDSFLWTGWVRLLKKHPAELDPFQTLELQAEITNNAYRKIMSKFVLTFFLFNLRAQYFCYHCHFWPLYILKRINLLN